MAALAVIGFVSRALLYAAQPGTAPPLTTDSSRKRGETEEGSLVLSPETTDGLLEVFLTRDGRWETPNAWAVRQDAATRTVTSFILDTFVLFFVENDSLSNFHRGWRKVSPC